MQDVAERITDVAANIEDNILKIVGIEKTQREERTFGQRLSEGIASFAGSMIFVYIHILWFAAWILVNTLLLKNPIDPFPFTFLTFVVSLEAIFLSTFILISQNHEAKLTEHRNHLDLQINLLSEQENTKMLELLQAIAEKVGVPCDDEALQDLLTPVDPKEMTDRIVQENG